jgi:Transglutaminase-like superfamily
MKFFKYIASFETQLPTTDFASENMKVVRDIRFSIKLIATYTPWTNVCRYQAKVLCNRYKILYKIYVGFKKNEFGKLEGHAWTMVYGKIITGFCRPEEYTVQAIYSNEKSIG